MLNLISHKINNILCIRMSRGTHFACHKKRSIAWKPFRLSRRNESPKSNSSLLDIISVSSIGEVSLMMFDHVVFLTNVKMFRE